VTQTSAKSFAFAICILFLSLQAFAVLGEDASSVQADQAHINAGLRVTQKPAYMLHELRSSTGMVVREFASSGGKVFAVAWQGPWHPDLKQLLGSHFEEFEQAAEAQKRRGVHGPLLIQQSGLVVELDGHMRGFSGRAYLPDQVPAGVREEDLR
jgi:hypothetical protein